LRKEECEKRAARTIRSSEGQRGADKKREEEKREKYQERGLG